MHEELIQNLQKELKDKNSVIDHNGHLLNELKEVKDRYERINSQLRI
jgi:hypothetical protein